MRQLKWEKGFRFHDQDGKVSTSKIQSYSESQPFECHIWNSQSIEVKGKIYMTGGTIAATTHYLRTLSVLNETTWTFRKGLANMHHARDGHGLISWRDRYLIVVGTWHHIENAKTAEMYDIRRNKWIKLP